MRARTVPKKVEHRVMIIKKHTAATCYLEQQNIKLGDISSQEIPIKVLAGEESPAYSIEYMGPAGPDIILTYQCGNEKYVSIESRRLETLDPIQIPGKRLKVSEHIFGSILSLSNMQATFEVFTKNCSKNIPSTIIWTFE